MSDSMISVPHFIIQIVIITGIALISYVFNESLRSIRNEIDEMKEAIKERAKVAHQRIVDKDKAHKEEFINLSMQHKDDMKDIFTLMTSRTHCDATQKLWQANFEHLMDQNKKEHDYLIASMRDMSERMDKLAECVHKLANKREC